MNKSEYNNQINDVYDKLNKIAEIHKSNQSKFNIIHEDAKKEISLAESLAEKAYEADREAKKALQTSLESAKNAKYKIEIKPDQQEISKLENEIEDKIKIHEEALKNYKAINLNSERIIKYVDPLINISKNKINDLIEEIKILSKKTYSEYQLADKYAKNVDKHNLDIHQNLAVKHSNKIIKLRQEIDAEIDRLKGIQDDNNNNIKKIQQEEIKSKNEEMKTRKEIELIRIQNRRKIKELIEKAKVDTVQANIDSKIKAKNDSDLAEAAEKKRKELEIKSHNEDHISLNLEKNRDEERNKLLLKNIELWKGINPNIHSNLDTLNKNLTDKVDRNVLELLSNEILHPYPELLRGEIIPNQTGGSLKILDMVNIIDLPNVWSKDHHKMFRDNLVLKALSLNPNVLKELKLFKNNSLRCKTIVLMLFWDIQDLIIICKELNVDNLDSYKNLVKNTALNNATIKEFVNFANDNVTGKGKTAQFVLTEDLIIFYKEYCDKYIINKYEDFKYQESFNNNEVKIFARLLADFKHWTNLNEQFNLLKKNLNLLHEEINLKYSLENIEPIKTYLKIRCDTYDKQLYNEYFNIFADSKEKKNKELESVYITGPNININVPFYTPKDKIDASCPIVPSNILLNNDCTLKEIVSYDYGYLYGPFTQVFLPASNNKEISNQCSEIFNSLKNNKSVFVIGYGASGAGKTSALIYNTFTKEDGIILELLNNKELGLFEINVSVHELYAKGSKIECNKYNDIIFKKNPKKIKDGFILDTVNNGKNGKYIQNNKVLNGDDITWKDSECSWNFSDNFFTHSKTNKKINKLNDFIITLVEDVRMIRPTPNNNESSRSHVLIYFKIVVNGTFVNLIVGDFAGVENKFKCSENLTKKQFFNLKDNKSGKSYYANNENEIENLCNERTTEGLFINNSLYGMRKDLENVVKDNKRISLFSKIPIFNSPCLEYYCNQHSYNCFNLPDINTDTKYENAIFNNIWEKIGNDIKLDIIIFGVLNINRNYNNPPKIPYIDLTFLKLKRDELYTSKQYENKSDQIKNIVSEIKNHFESDIKPVLEIFKLSINQLLLDGLNKRYEQIITDNLPLNQVYPVLINLINIIEEINSTSVLGTLDFMHAMKNSLKTDMACNIFKLAKTDPDRVLHDIYDYKNIINFNSTKTLHDVLINQKARINQENTMAVTRGGGKGMSEKEKLLKEYKMLKKMLK
jgi:hypothetical protein